MYVCIYVLRCIYVLVFTMYAPKNNAEKVYFYTIDTRDVRVCIFVCMYICTKLSMVRYIQMLVVLILTLRILRGEDVVAVVVAAGDGAPAHDGYAAH